LAELAVVNFRTPSLRRPARGAVLLGVATIALVFVNPAFAHAGKTAPVATDFQARIAGVEPASPEVEAKVVDGDAALWLRVRRRATVLIPGAEGEPMLLFDPRGVFVNTRSLTAQSDRIDPLQLRPDPNPRATPSWRRLTEDHTYRWHEHRLHALESLSRSHRATTVLGAWMVPLVIDGRSHRLVGTLVYHPPGSIWPWILLAVVLAAIPVAAASFRPTRAGKIARWAAVPSVLVVWILRAARELYGRPEVGVIGYSAVALTCLVGTVLLYGLFHRDRSIRTFTALFAGIGGIYEGLTLLPVLTHAVPLTTLPSFLVRLAVAAALGLGAGATAVALREQFRTPQSTRTRTTRVETRPERDASGRSERSASA